MSTEISTTGISRSFLPRNKERRWTSTRISKSVRKFHGILEKFIARMFTDVEFSETLPDKGIGWCTSISFLLDFESTVEGGGGY